MKPALVCAVLLASTVPALAQDEGTAPTAATTEAADAAADAPADATAPAADSEADDDAVADDEGDDDEALAGDEGHDKKHDKKHDRKHDKKHDKKHDEKHGKASPFTAAGRVFVTSQLAKVEGNPTVDAHTAVTSARAKVKYKKKHLRAELEVELADKPRLKNAYVQLAVAHAVSVKAGSFKMPFSAVQLTSGWTLPMADRGLISTILVSRLQVAGRTPGVTLELKPGGSLHPRLIVGVFQGADDAGTPLDVSVHDGFGQDVVARATVRPTDGVTIGVAGSLRSGEKLVLPATVRHAYAGELDVTVDRALGGAHLRVWAEAMAGTSWLVAGTDPSHDQATFAEARVIATVRIGEAEKWKRHVDPYVLVGALDPDSSFGGDLALELTGGLSVGAGDHWRVQLEAERWTVGDNAPNGLVALGAAPADQTRGLVMLAAHF